MQVHFTKWEAKRLADILRNRAVPECQAAWADDTANRLEVAIEKHREYQNKQAMTPEKLRKASNDELRRYYRLIDDMPDSAQRRAFLSALDAESSRRAAIANESISGGEWM